MNFITLLQCRDAKEANQKRRIQVRVDGEQRRYIQMSDVILSFPGAVGLEFQDPDKIWTQLTPDNLNNQQIIFLNQNQPEYVVMVQVQASLRNSQYKQLLRRVEEITISDGKPRVLLDNSVREYFSKTQMQNVARCLRTYGIKLRAVSKLTSTDELWSYFYAGERPQLQDIGVIQPEKFTKSEVKNSEKMNSYIRKALDGTRWKVMPINNGNYTLQIPYAEYLTFVGRSDSIVVEDEEYDEYTPCQLMIEFKVNDKNLKATCQPIMELLGSIVQHKSPCMVVTTDLEIFRFTYLRDGAVIEAVTTARQSAFQFIREWAEFRHQLSDDDAKTTQRAFNEASELFIKQQAQANIVKNVVYIDELPFRLSDPAELALPDYMRSIESQVQSDQNKTLKPNRGRSGQVYYCTLPNSEITIAVKLHSCNHLLSIYEEMRNEISIYTKLGDKTRFESTKDLVQFLANNEITWRPRMVYGGFLFNRNYLCLCSTYVGQAFVANNIGPEQKKAFEQALGELHKRHIVHGDVRPPNLAWSKKNTGAILDFGFSRFIEDEDELKKYKQIDLENLDKLLVIS